MTSFHGRGPPGALPPGLDDNVDARALKNAGGEFLECASQGLRTITHCEA